MADAIVTTNITGQQQQKQQQQQQQQQAQTNIQSNKKKSKNKKKNSTVNNNIINNNNAGSKHGGVENSNKFNGIEALNNGKARTTTITAAETMLTNGEINKLLDQLNITETPINGHANCHNGQVTGANDIDIGIGIDAETEIANENETEAEAEIALDIVATKSKAKSKQKIAQQQKDKHCHATNKLTEEEEANTTTSTTATTTKTITTTTTNTIGEREQVQQEQNVATALCNGHVPMLATVTSTSTPTTLNITNNVLADMNDVKLQTTPLTTTATTKTNASSSSKNSTGALPKTKPPSKSTAKTKLIALNIEEPTTSNAAAAVVAAEAAARALAAAETEAAAILGLTNVDAKLTENNTNTTTTTTSSTIIAANVGSSNNNDNDDAVNDNDDDDDDDKTKTTTTTAQETITELMPATSDIHIEYTEYESEHQMHDIMRLIQAELSEPYSIYTYRYFIYNWPKLCFLARHGNDYVGAIVCKLDMHMNVRRGYIAMLAVRKEYRKLKIGTTLVQKAIEAMLADNADEVVLETEMRNVPALRLYENLGFVRDKRLFRYYLNGVDALRLKLWFR